MNEPTETLDPRVQVELERLNSATDEINRREVQLDEARLVFKQKVTESHIRLQQLSKKLGNCIQKARPYYEARFKAHLASQELQAATAALEKANSAHSAAREMVYLAEQGLSRLSAEAGEGGGVPLDPAWQEMLNHATARVNQAVAERTTAGTLHRMRSVQHGSATNLVLQLHASLKRHITKSRPYYEEKARINSSLEAQKVRVESLERDVSEAKLSYARALRSLEKISDEIHRHRSLQGSVQNGDSVSLNLNGSKEDSVIRWLQDSSVVLSHSNGDGLPRPHSLPQEFADKCIDLLTPRTPATERSPGPSDADNWSEINLECSQREDSFHKCSEYCGRDDERQVPYERLQAPTNGSERTTPDSAPSLSEAPPTGCVASRVSAASPRRIIKPRAMSCVAGEIANGADMKRAGSIKSRLKEELVGRVKREETARRQSLDVILTDTSERVREMLQGFSLFGSGGERRTSAPASPPRSPPPAPPARRLPSPLDRTLSYLSVNDSDDPTSDTDSLASVEMLSEEQVRSLMLDPQLEMCCQLLMSNH